VNTPLPTLDLILTSPESVAALSREAVSELLTQNAAVGAILAARLVAALTQKIKEQRESDEWLDIDTAAMRLKKSRRWIFRNARELPFVSRVSRKTILCSAKGIDRYLEKRLEKRLA
jgi:hypothetical protein